MKRRFLIVLCAALMVCTLAVRVCAVEGVDMDRKGSISITMRYQDGLVPGGTLTIYRVAQVLEEDGNYSFGFVEEFADCGLSLEVLNEQLAKDLMDYAVVEALVATTGQISEEGFVRFTDLELGLYLVVQYDPAEGFSPVSPFLVSVPGTDGEGYVYDVDGSPKLSLEPAPTEPPETTEPTEPKPTEPNLPQTGQLNWPVPVLAVSGLLLLLLGWYMRRAARKESYEG